MNNFLKSVSSSASLKCVRVKISYEIETDIDKYISIFRNNPNLSKTAIYNGVFKYESINKIIDFLESLTQLYNL